MKNKEGQREDLEDVQKMVLKYWKLVEQMHGPMRPDYDVSKQNAMRLLNKQSSLQFSDKEAVREVLDDPAGAKSLFFVLLHQAIRRKWAISSLPEIREAVDPDIKFDKENFGRHGAMSFCLEALSQFEIQELAEKIGKDFDRDNEESKFQRIPELVRQFRAEHPY